jgi:predicted HTH domain antitoxin
MDADLERTPRHSPPQGPRYGATMSATPRTRMVQVELPEEAFTARRWEPEGLAEELRLLFLLEEVRNRRLGYGRAAEMAGMGVARFVKVMASHGISQFDYDAGELEEEMRR